MPSVKVRVYNTQNNEYSFDQVVDVKTFGDIQTLIGHQPNARYTDKATRSDPFSDTSKLVAGDVTIFMSPSKSKAGC